MSFILSLQCEEGRLVDDAQNDIIMYNDVSQANPQSYPLYMKNGQKYVACHHEGVSVSLCVLIGSTR